jgi:hypothetical protein
MVCRKIRKLIDESDRPDALPHQVMTHTAICDDCRQFAHQRMRLRQLLRTPARVVAPPNFDAMLRARLAERTARRRFGIRSPSRLATITAAAIIAISIAFYIQGNKPAVIQTAGEGNAASSNQVAAGTTANQVQSPQTKRLSGEGKAYGRLLLVRRRLDVRSKDRIYTSDTADDLDAQPAAVLLMRSGEAERELMVPAISVGAEPIFQYTSFGKRATRNVRTSF